MNDLQIITNDDGTIAVLCSNLYKDLKLEPSHFVGWTNRNVTNSKFAIENTDYIVLTRTKGEVNKSKKAKDFILTLDFAKRLAMMCKTEQGENVRNYFLKCEQIAKTKETELQQSLFNELLSYRRLEMIRLEKIALNKEVKALKKIIPQPQNAPNIPKNFQFNLNFE